MPSDWLMDCQKDCFQDSLECKVCLVKPQVGISISCVCVNLILCDSFLCSDLLVVMPPKSDDWWLTYRGRGEKKKLDKQEAKESEEDLREKKKLDKQEAKEREEVRIFSIILS